jgi:AMMECR1 domain-containing protein
VVIETPSRARSAAVFVSLHLLDGSLRCIGTTEPHRTTLEEEIVANAPARHADPRFYPLEKHELENLDISWMCWSTRRGERP